MNAFFLFPQPGGHAYGFKLNFNIWKLHAANDMFVQHLQRVNFKGKALQALNNRNMLLNHLAWNLNMPIQRSIVHVHVMVKNAFFKLKHIEKILECKQVHLIFITDSESIFLCYILDVYKSVLEFKLAYCLAGEMGGSLKYPYLHKGR